jgi:hypothetical protein
VLSQDPLAGSVDLREVRVDMTVVGGQTAYQREPSGHQQEVR